MPIISNNFKSKLFSVVFGSIMRDCCCGSTSGHNCCISQQSAGCYIDVDPLTNSVLFKATVTVDYSFTYDLYLGILAGVPCSQHHYSMNINRSVTFDMGEATYDYPYPPFPQTPQPVIYQCDQSCMGIGQNNDDIGNFGTGILTVYHSVYNGGLGCASWIGSSPSTGITYYNVTSLINLSLGKTSGCTNTSSRNDWSCNMSLSTGHNLYMSTLVMSTGNFPNQSIQGSFFSQFSPGANSGILVEESQTYHSLFCKANGSSIFYPFPSIGSATGSSTVTSSITPLLNEKCVYGMAHTYNNTFYINIPYYSGNGNETLTYSYVFNTGLKPCPTGSLLVGGLGYLL